MLCPRCGESTRVINSRSGVAPVHSSVQSTYTSALGQGNWRWRRRECAGKHRFSTAEVVLTPVAVNVLKGVA